MNLFALALNDCLQEQKTNEKIRILADYFQQESIENRPIALHLLMGENFGRFCSGKLLREWCAEVLQLSQWLIDESYEALGDNSETISLCFGRKLTKKGWALADLCDQMLGLKSADIEQKKAWVLRTWEDLSADHIYVFNKLLGGGIRIGASKKNVLKALGQAFNMDVAVLEQRLLGRWDPTVDMFEALINPNDQFGKGVAPYPFFLASALPDSKASVISVISEWQIEPKWDGIRAQLVHRESGTALWSRGNDLISEQFPEILKGADQLAHGVYDGEILAWQDGQPRSFFHLQKRLNRKSVSKKMLEETPCVMKLYDCLEYEGADIRDQLLPKRRQRLTLLPAPFLLSQPLTFDSLIMLDAYISKARAHNVEGVILKRLNSIYQSGRVRGDWWKWKVDPLTLDVVIMYAQKGRGIRSGLFTDYTFGVWDGPALVPIGKAYSGLTNQEIKTVNQQIKAHLTDKFGPVRGVAPVIVIEVAFDDIQPSSRHKSGLALRFPRIQRLRPDKPVSQANSLQDALELCNK